MKVNSAALIASLSAAALMGFAGASFSQQPEGLKEVSSFEAIPDETARSIALFEEMAKVITHPRCMNCHPRDASPRQGMDMRLHNPPVIRNGPSGMGAPGMQCTTCHGSENVGFVGSGGSIPGHDPWHLPPVEMGWIGLSKAAICEQLKDVERNGGKSLAELQQHNAEDGLVGWAWKPGKGREPAPGTQELFGALTQAWIDSGAHCPRG